MSENNADAKESLRKAMNFITTNLNAMSLPGLGLTEQPAEVAAAEVPATVHELPESSEWRFEVAFGETVEVKVRTLPTTLSAPTYFCLQLFNRMISVGSYCL